MSAHDLSALVAFAHELADLARAETLPRFRRGVAVDIKEAAEWDPVTEADREAARCHHPRPSSSLVQRRRQRRMQRQWPTRQWQWP